jgi:hypothetical protein
MARPAARLLPVLLVSFLLSTSGGASVVSATRVTPSDQPSSSFSVFLNCTYGNITFSLPSTQGSCSQSFLYGKYTGIPQSVGGQQRAAFYATGATGKLNITYSVVDVTTSKTLFSGWAAGSVSGGSCSSPAVISGNGAVTTSTTMNTDDVLELELTPLFIGSGSPVLCSGGSYPSLVTAGTTPLLGGLVPLLTTTLTPGMPRQASIGAYSGVSISYLNTASQTFTVLVYGVVRSGAGSLAGVVVTSISLSPNQNVTAFLAMRGFPSGSYTVTVFAVTTGDVPLTSIRTVQVSL